MTTDLELIQQIRKGNQLVFSELVSRHQKGLLRVTVRIVKSLQLAEDVVQEAFIKCYQKLHLFEGRSSFKSWLYQIAVNTAKNKLRSLKKEVVDIDKVQISIAPKAESTLVYSDIQKKVRMEVEKLPLKQRTAILLRIFEDLSFKEIAEIMKCPYDTAKANYRHGLMKLRHKMSNNTELMEWSLMKSDFSMDIKGKVAEVEQ